MELFCVGMVADLPIVNYHFNIAFNFFITGAFSKKTLDSHLGIGFIYDFLANKG